MKKSDLKNGMVVELRNGERYLVLNGDLVDKNFNSSLNLDFYINDTMKVNKRKIDEILNRKVDYSKLDINKVFADYTSLLMKGLESVIWKREEIDWTKVPFGTIVECWNDESSKYVGKFLGYDESVSPKFMVFVSTDIITDWDYCELKDLKGEITGENLNDEFDRYCENYKCEDCEYDSTQDCRLYWMVDNFNLTRK